MSRSYRVLASVMLLTGLTAACSSDVPTESQNSPLAGLTAVSTNDTAKTPPSSNTGTGFIKGYILGPSLPGATDTLNTAPRIPDVRVTIYDRAPSGPGEVVPGTQRGSVLTNAQGHFQLPELPVGEYVVTFVPPESSIYRGTYSYGPIRSNSGESSWWIVLPRK